MPYVHRKTIGRFSRKYLKADSRMDIGREDTPYGGRTRSTLDNGPELAWLDFYKPSILVLLFEMTNRRIVNEDRAIVESRCRSRYRPPGLSSQCAPTGPPCRFESTPSRP